MSRRQTVEYDYVIFHICGPSGSGKTYLGNMLKERYGDRIVVKDLDDLRDEFIRKFYGQSSWTYIDVDEYQNYIDNYIGKQRKPIIFVGLNDNPRGKNKRHYYDVHSTYNFYIDIDDMVVVKQKCLRLLNDIQNDEMALHDLMHNNQRFVKMFTGAIKRECNAKETIKMNNRWRKYYARKKYMFMPREEIFMQVSMILNHVMFQS